MIHSNQVEVLSLAGLARGVFCTWFKSGEQDKCHPTFDKVIFCSMPVLESVIKTPVTTPSSLSLWIISLCIAWEVFSPLHNSSVASNAFLLLDLSNLSTHLLLKVFEDEFDPSATRANDDRARTWDPPADSRSLAACWRSWQRYYYSWGVGSYGNIVSKGFHLLSEVVFH